MHVNVKWSWIFLLTAQLYIAAHRIMHELYQITLSCSHNQQQLQTADPD